MNKAVLMERLTRGSEVRCLTGDNPMVVASSIWSAQAGL